MAAVEYGTFIICHEFSFLLIKACWLATYMAHSSASSASETKGSSMALMARSPQRILFVIHGE